MKHSYTNIQQLYNKYPWKSSSKFIPLAIRHGFKENDIRDFLKNIVRDKRIKIKPVYLPIYSKIGGSYQFDTFIQHKGPHFLIFININTRKAFSYPMKNKSAKEVLNALKQFFKDVKDVKVLRSDQDAAYLSNNVLEYLKSKQIQYYTTEDENHNILGIINRFIRTIRDLSDNKIISPKRMTKLINEYNNTVHRSIGMAPNKMNKDKELKYIEEKNEETINKTNVYNFNINDRVRIILDKQPLTKHRNNLSKGSYIIIDKSGTNYLIRANDYSADYYPGYKLIKCSNNVPLSQTLKNEKRGIVQSINNYDSKKDKYYITYEGGVNDFIPSKYMREGDPLRLSKMEQSYWLDYIHKNNNTLPSKIAKFV